MESQQKIDLTGRRIGMLLNTSSGSCDVAAEQDAEACLRAVGLEPVRIWCGGGDQVDRALQEADEHKLDVMIVLGGDGTIRAAAERCDANGPLLIPLPGGTMNMLPKALYDTRPWREALADTLKDPVLQDVHGAQIEGKRFFIAGIFGGPARMAEAREAVREGHIVEAVEKGVTALRTALSEGLGYSFGNSQGHAEAVAVLCPLTSKALDSEEQVLEAAAIELKGPVEALRLGLTAAFTDWRNDASVVLSKVRSLDLASDHPIPGILDGESFEFSPTAQVRVLPQAFRALRPTDAS